MSFVNEHYAIIRRSNKEMFYMYLKEDGLYYNYYDVEGNIVNIYKLIDDNTLDFTKYSFSLDQDNNIYCIYCNNTLKVLECKDKSSTFREVESITYNYKKFGLVFPYIKFSEDNPHIFYYVFNNSSINTCAIFHHYKHNDYWIENKIDFVNHIALDDFTVLFNRAVPTIFYFNLVNGCEEIFSSRFNFGTFTWSDPVQITNTGNNKLYLNAIRDSINFYHLCYCENEGNGYIVKYINGYLNENSFNLKNLSSLSSPSTCMFPSLIKADNTLVVSWVDLNKLYTSTSKNGGASWSNPVIDESSAEDNFTRCTFLSNYKDDLKYNVSNVFSTIDDVGILGI